MSVQTYQSHRTSAQRVVQQEYTVDENGASLNALSRNSDGAAEEQLPTASPTTSIYIRDWKVHFFSTPAPHHPSPTPPTPSLPLAPPPPRILPWHTPAPSALHPPSSHPSVSPIGPPSLVAPQLSGRRAFIQYDRDDQGFWFNPVVNDQDRPHTSASTPGFPCSRGDIFLKLGMRGARLIPWKLQEGSVFRLGQAYVLVSKVRLTSDALDVSAFSPLLDDGAGAHAAERSRDTVASVDESEEESESARPPLRLHECYICYEAGTTDNPLINPCQCTGSVKYVHLNCLQRWIQPEGTSAVNTHCSICKARSDRASCPKRPDLLGCCSLPLPSSSPTARLPSTGRYPEKAQAMMIRPPALLLESWSNHRSLKLRHWVSFAHHSAASLGRFADHNDVVIPDHSVSGEHALIIHSDDRFWLHDRESSNGSFIRLSEPLRLGFGESLQMKMGKSLLCLQAKRSRWSRLRMRLNMLRLGIGDRADDGGAGTGRAAGGPPDPRDCAPPPPPLRTQRDTAAAANARWLPPRPEEE